MYFRAKSATQNVYNSFEACYKGVLKPAYDAASASRTSTEASNKPSTGDSQSVKDAKAKVNAGLKASKAFFEKGGYALFKQIEGAYKCASICYKPLFYIA